MTTGDIADQLGASAGTIRRWADAFGDFLSAGTNPPKGEVRHFTEDDFELLTAVAYYSKEQHLNYDAIREKLEAGEHLEEAIPTAAELRGAGKPAPQPEPAPAAQAMPAAQFDSLIQEIQALSKTQQTTRQALSEQIKTLKQQIGALERTLAPREQVAELQTLVQELQQIVTQQTEDETAHIQRIAHLEQQVHQLQVHQLQTMLEEQSAHRSLRRLHHALSHGMGRATTWVISWTLFLITALGMLYYFLIIVRPATLP